MRGELVGASAGLGRPSISLALRRRARSTPPRNRATSSSGRWVADSPIRCERPVAPIAASRSIDSARCAPRLVGTSA